MQAVAVVRGITVYPQLVPTKLVGQTSTHTRNDLGVAIDQSLWAPVHQLLFFAHHVVHFVPTPVNRRTAVFIQTVVIDRWVVTNGRGLVLEQVYLPLNGSTLVVVGDPTCLFHLREHVVATDRVILSILQFPNACGVDYTCPFFGHDLYSLKDSC